MFPWELPYVHCIERENRGLSAGFLIGLLLPAVQKMRDAANSDRAQLTSLLAPGGRFGVSGDSSFVFDNITWT